MKKLILLVGILLISGVNAFATSYTAPYASATTGSFIFASQWNANQTALESFLNNQNLDGTTNIAVGGIQTQNIANSAVTDVKIAGITTAGKVNGSAITAISNLPSGAGVIPTANLGSGSPSASNVLLGNQTYGYPSGMLGSWSIKSVGSIYQASTDLWVTCLMYTTSGDPYVSLLTDSSSTPSTVRGQLGGANISSSSIAVSISTVVKKNDYYECTTTNNGGVVSSTAMYIIPTSS